MWHLHVFLVFLHDSWIADVFTSLPFSWDNKLLLGVRVSVCTRICVRPGKPSLPSPKCTTENQMNEYAKLSAIGLPPAAIHKRFPSVWLSRKCKEFASSICHQAACCIPPSAVGEIWDVSPSITTDSHLAGMLLLKLCDNVPRKRRLK